MPGRSVFFSLLFVFLLVLPVHAGSGNGNWFLEYGGKRGFYWYEKPPVKKKKKKEAKKKEKKAPARYTFPQLLSMSPDALGKELRRALSEAVKNPTEDSVSYYLLVQEAVRRKVMAFVNVYEFTLQKHPEFTVPAYFMYPAAVPGQRARDRVVFAERKRVLSLEKENFGLILFVKKGCPYCEAEMKIVEVFEVKWGWSVKVVDVEENPDLSRKLGISMVPSIVVVSRKTGKYMPVSIGVVALNELEERLVRAIRYLEGKTTPRDFLMDEYIKALSRNPLLKGTNDNSFQ